MAFFACAGNVSAAASVAVTKPANLLAGDVLIACCASYRSTSAAPSTATIANTGSGGSSWSSVTNQTTATYYKTAYATKTVLTDGDGSVTAYTWSAANAVNMCAAVIVLRGRNTIAPTPISNTAYVTSDTNVRAAALTATADADLVWWGYNYRSTVQATAIPSGWSSGTVQTAAAAIGGAMAYKEDVSSGTTGVVNGTIANAVATKHAFMFNVQIRKALSPNNMNGGATATGTLTEWQKFTAVPLTTSAVADVVDPLAYYYFILDPNKIASGTASMDPAVLTKLDVGTKYQASGTASAVASSPVATLTRKIQPGIAPVSAGATAAILTARRYLHPSGTASAAATATGALTQYMRPNTASAGATGTARLILYSRLATASAVATAAASLRRYVHAGGTASAGAASGASASLKGKLSAAGRGDAVASCVTPMLRRYVHVSGQGDALATASVITLSKLRKQLSGTTSAVATASAILQRKARIIPTTCSAGATLAVATLDKQVISNKNMVANVADAGAVAVPVVGWTDWIIDHATANAGARAIYNAVTNYRVYAFSMSAAATARTSLLKDKHPLIALRANAGAGGQFATLFRTKQLMSTPTMSAGATLSNANLRLLPLNHMVGEANAGATMTADLWRKTTLNMYAGTVYRFAIASAITDIVRVYGDPEHPSRITGWRTNTYLLILQHPSLEIANGSSSAIGILHKNTTAMVPVTASARATSIANMGAFHFEWMSPVMCVGTASLDVRGRGSVHLGHLASLVTMNGMATNRGILGFQQVYHPKRHKHAQRELDGTGAMRRGRHAERELDAEGADEL